MSSLLLPLPALQGDHLSACLVMVDLVGSTALAHRLPLEHYAALMAEFVQLLILTCEAQGGQVLQHQGDAVLALWPAAHTERAVQAALETHERSARLSLAELLGVQLRVRAGVALGTVVMGPVGGQPSAYGLPVNYARRLCDAAAPGETLVCEEVARQALPGTRISGRALPPLRGFGPGGQAYAAQRLLPPVPLPMKTG